MHVHDGQLIITHTHLSVLVVFQSQAMHATLCNLSPATYVHEERIILEQASY